MRRLSGWSHRNALPASIRGRSAVFFFTKTSIVVFFEWDGSVCITVDRAETVVVWILPSRPVGRIDVKLAVFSSRMRDKSEAVEMFFVTVVPFTYVTLNAETESGNSTSTTVYGSDRLFSMKNPFSGTLFLSEGV